MAMNTTSGRSLAIVMPSMNSALCRMPRALMSAMPRITVMISAMRGRPAPNTGQKYPTASPMPWTSAAMLATRVNQLIHPTSNATNGPKAASVYRYGPPVLSKRLPTSAYESAMHSTASPTTMTAIGLQLPSCAATSEGVRKTPPPMTMLMPKAVRSQRPRARCRPGADAAGGFAWPSLFIRPSRGAAQGKCECPLSVERAAIDRENGLQEHVRAVRHVLGRGEFLGRVTDTADARHEDHAGGRDVSHVLSIVARTAGHELMLQAERLGGARDDAPHAFVGGRRFGRHLQLRECNRCLARLRDLPGLRDHGGMHLLDLRRLEIADLEAHDDLARNHV